MGTWFQQPIAPPTLPCKCCGNPATLFGVVDFNKNCVIAQRLLDPCGIPIYYHRCQTCGFIFTTALDGFTSEDFAKWIYNDQYPLLDPDYAENRPSENANFSI